jgi:sRNA-binding regulator protein Hfq
MNPICLTKKGGLMNALEKFYIYKETQKDNQINYKHTIQYNPIFEAVLKTPPTQKITQ